MGVDAGVVFVHGGVVIVAVADRTIDGASLEVGATDRVGTGLAVVGVALEGIAADVGAAIVVDEVGVAGEAAGVLHPVTAVNAPTSTAALITTRMGGSITDIIRP